MVWQRGRIRRIRPISGPGRVRWERPVALAGVLFSGLVVLLRRTRHGRRRVLFGDAEADYDDPMEADLDS